jgi:signal transduction histidine kinase
MKGNATAVNEKMRAMNEALILGSVRQHELTEAAESSNALLQKEITDRKRVEAALRESEKRYRTLFDFGPVGVYSCDDSGVIQEFNQRAAEIWGRTPVRGDTSERFCGSFKLFRTDGSFISPRQCPMAQVLSGKIPAVHNAEVIVERPDGSRVIAIVDIRPFKNEQGKIMGAVNCFFDINEHKQAEEAQRRIAVLAATNQKLELEITQRRAVEQSLTASEQQQRRLLEESRHMRDQLRLLSRQLLSAQEAERQRISRDLHDVIAQSLTGISLRLASLKEDAGLSAKNRARNIARTQQLVEQSVNVVHQFARELRPSVLDDVGLIPALHTFMKGFKKETGIQVKLSAFAAVEHMKADKRIVFYRIAQEALTNVARHAKASRVELSLQHLDGVVCMKIKDNGQGLPAESVGHDKKSKRLGLLGMRERLEMVGGNFTIESIPGQGTTITAQIPFDENRAQPVLPGFTTPAPEQVSPAEEVAPEPKVKS